MSDKTENTELQTADSADIEVADKDIEAGDKSVSMEEQESPTLPILR